ncbi:MAG: isochorismatase family protein [Planctomycetota bacterium]|nr:isochorismatase family protein [Planctomycetota bacterium]
MAFYEFEGKRPSVGEGSYVSPDAVVIGDVKIGKDCYIGPGAVIKGDYGPIIIGDNTNIQENSIVHGRPEETTRIGDRVTVGHCAIIHTCTVEDDVLVGMGAIVSDYAVVGKHSIVAEGAVVVNGQKIGENVIVGGIPAKEIGKIDNKTRERFLGYKMLYSQLARRYERSCRQVPEYLVRKDTDTSGLIDEKRTVLVVVDMQEKLFRMMLDKEKVLKNVIRLIRFAKTVEIPIVVTEQYPKGLGKTMEEVKRELPDGVEVIEKVAFGCFGEKRFAEKLKELSAKDVVVCGIEAHICVGQTVAGAPRDYRIFLVADATSSPTEIDKSVAIERAKMSGVIPTTTEMFMFEYLRAAKTEKFEKCLDILRR